MSRVGQCVTWVWVLSTSVLGTPQDSSFQQECNYVYKLKKGENIHLHAHNFTRNHYCTMKVSADAHLRLVVNLVYSPPQAAGDTPQPDCTSDYVHVGNDVERLDVDLMTSYKFCGEGGHHELVSSGNYMWLVYRGSRPPSEFSAKVSAQGPVTCVAEEFRCSPVQCVHRSKTCDGVKDCTNGHDEYCRGQGQLRHSPSLCGMPGCQVLAMSGCQSLRTVDLRDLGGKCGRCHVWISGYTVKVKCGLVGSVVYFRQTCGSFD